MTHQFLDVVKDKVRWVPFGEGMEVRIGMLVKTVDNEIHLVGDVMISSIKPDTVARTWGGSGRQLRVTHIAYLTDLINMPMSDSMMEALINRLSERLDIVERWQENQDELAMGDDI
jgi:hypothetical protein